MYFGHVCRTMNEHLHVVEKEQILGAESYSLDFHLCRMLEVAYLNLKAPGLNRKCFYRPKAYFDLSAVQLCL